MGEETNLAKIVHNIKLNAQAKKFVYDSDYACICAGGIIYDAQTNKVLVVQGREKWSLPKGHRELGEELYETAMREIYEETSLKVILNEKCQSKKILKSIYYLIAINNSESIKLNPIDTTEVIGVRWCNKEELYLLDCNKQLKYLIRRWDNIIAQFSNSNKIAKYV